MSDDCETWAILAIARRVLRVPTLEARRSDRLDFYDLGVWQIEEALRAAYRAGAASVALKRQPRSKPRRRASR